MALATRNAEQRAPHRHGPSAGARGWLGVDVRALLPVLFAAANGLAFYLIRPDVNDLWAARARASAADHGVGLTYWFSWFGGGTTPGNYSVVTPYVSALIGTELVAALSAVAVTALAAVAVRGTRYPVAATWVAAVAAALNTWSGRVPFLFGMTFAVGAIIAVRSQRRAAAIVLTLVSILASPVSGAFICMGLTGTFLTTRTKEYRSIVAWTVGTASVALVGVAVLFGAPGSEPFSIAQLVAVGLTQLWLVSARPADHVRTTLAASLLTTIVLFLIPNGMGSNFSRFAYFCLPVAVVATSGRRLPVALFSAAPVLVAGAVGTAVDLVNASRPISSVSYYTSLAHRLDKIPDLNDYRVEVVNHGAHAGYDALLEHALLARGWETQEDHALNGALLNPHLDPVTYKVWLDNNAVGYVALPASSVQSYPEYTLVREHRPNYLRRIWSDPDWQLFEVQSPTPIVGRPAGVLAHDQKTMTIRVPCSCTLPVRVRWSKFLTATLQSPGRGGRMVDAVPTLTARVLDDGSGWTTLTTTKAGTYVLRGSLRGLLR